MDLAAELKWRGLVDNVSHEEIYSQLNDKKLKFYIGFDPTSSSIQIGNFLQITTMKRLQLAGHTPYILVGGATGMIGDPSGKSAERNLLDQETLQANVEKMVTQLSQFLDFSGENAAVVVNNYDWMKGFSYLEFLRDVGKRFRLSEMLAKDSVKSRISSDSGISYTEFSYQILQSYDFAHLYKNHGVTLQMGASDQWGNITAGIDLTRRLHGGQVFAIVTPLVTDSQGNKFGKSEGGKTIYLDAEMTSPYQMYQFLLNSEDEKVVTYLKYYTFLSREEIEALEEKTKAEPHLRQAQKTLAKEVVKMVHGEERLVASERATSFFFGGKIEKVSDKEVDEIFSDVPSVSLSQEQLKTGISIVDLLSETPLFKSKGEARRSLQQKGVYLNNDPIEDGDMVVLQNHLASESALVIRKGKKNYCVVKFS